MVALPAIEKGRGQAERVGGFVSVGFLFSEILLSQNADVSDHRIFEGSSPQKKHRQNRKFRKCLVGGWTTHLKNISASQIGSSPQGSGVKSLKCLKPPPRCVIFCTWKKWKNLKTSTECLKHRWIHVKPESLKGHKKNTTVCFFKSLFFFRCFLLGRDNSTFLSFTQKDVDYGITIIFNGFWE